MLIAQHAPLRSALLSIRIQSSFPTPSCTAASTIVLQNQQRCISFRTDHPRRITTKGAITPTTAAPRLPTNSIPRRSTIPFHPRHASSSSSPSSNSNSSSPPPVLEPRTTSQPSLPAESASTVPIIDSTPDPTTSSAAAITPPSPPNNTTASTTASTTSTTTGPPPLMTWDAFFHHRKIRRRYNLAFSLTLSASAILVGAEYIAFQYWAAAQPSLDVFNNLIPGVDAIFVMIGATVAAGAVAWLTGPSVGGWVFGRIHRVQTGQFRDKEKEFFKHVKKYRPNAGYSSASNPLPDWYGEKIGSLREYRTWLKDQRAFNKRRESNPI